MSLIVIDIPGAKLLSSELSKNARIDPRKKAGITAKHRSGANIAVVKRIHELRLAEPMLNLATRPSSLFTHPLLKARSVVLTRICPERHMADGDNASTLLSATRDGVADALGVNDKVFVDNPTDEQIQAGAIALGYDQIVGTWGIRITIEV